MKKQNIFKDILLLRQNSVSSFKNMEEADLTQSGKSDAGTNPFSVQFRRRSRSNLSAVQAGRVLSGQHSQAS